MLSLRGEGEEEKREERKILVAIRFRETPVPIPNTKVKPEAAESTMLETAWEGRWLPDKRKGLIAQPVRAHA